MEPIRVLEAFGGIGAQMAALRRLGIPIKESYVCEIDEPAYRSYCAIHGDTPNLGDITKVEHIPEVDLLTWSYPCIRGDQLVYTDKGLVPIKDVKVGDMVLTHTGNYRKVLDSRMTGIHGTMKIQTAFGTLICTRDHMLLMKYRFKCNGHRDKDGRLGRTFSKEYWAPAITCCKDTYLGMPVNTREVLPQWNGDLKNRFSDPDFWKLCGMWIGDGWVNEANNSVIICCEKKQDEVERKFEFLNTQFSFKKYEERTTYKFRTSNAELVQFMNEFGKGAINKHIPQFVFDLPREHIQAFIEGYLDTDGFFNTETGEYNITSVSKQLVHDMVALIAKAYHRPSKIHYYKRPETTVIEGRTVNQHDSWMIRWHMDDRIQDKQFYENGIIWTPVKSTEILNPTMVYDLEVEEDHSFIASNIICHNCTSVSVAGKQEGMVEGSGTASSLGWEVIRLLRDAKERNCLPENLVMENVPALLQKKNIAEFERMCGELESLGYTNSYAVLNAKDFGVPQNRKRIFMVSSLHHGKFIFPKGFPLEKRLKDVLEKDVDESYYLSEERIAKYERHRQRQEENDRNFGWKPIDPNEKDMCNAVTTLPERHATGNYIKETDTRLEYAGHIGTSTHSGQRVYTVNSVSPCVRARDWKDAIKIEVEHGD